MDVMSACFSKFSKLSDFSIPGCKFHALCTVINGSNPTTFIPKFRQALATLTPTDPNPITPIVFPGSSYPTYCFLANSIFLLRSSDSSIFSI